MSDDSRLEALEAKLDKLLAVLAPSEPGLPPAPDNRYPPLVVAPEPVPDPILESSAELSAIGAAFRSRGTPIEASPAPGVEWEPIGDTAPVVSDDNRGAGHRLDHTQIAAHYRRDLAARLRPGPTVEDQNAVMLANG